MNLQQMKPEQYSALEPEWTTLGEILKMAAPTFLAHFAIGTWTLRPWHSSAQKC